MEQVGNDVMLMQFERREKRLSEDKEQKVGEEAEEKGFMAFLNKLFKKKKAILQEVPIESDEEADDAFEEEELEGFDVFDDDIPDSDDKEDGDF
jgi:formate dehydrogenase maturation protein FdhE